MMRSILNFLLLVSLLQATYALRKCQVSPKWRLNNVTFPNDFNTQVKFVALLKASCTFCRTQAKLIGQLQDVLRQENYTDITYLIINSFEPNSISRGNVFQTTVPVLQDIAKINVWKVYNGDTDDMLVFDKCNRLIAHLTLPDSVVDLNGGAVKEAIKKAYNEETCGKNCRPRKVNRVKKP